jgi:hypothetical protein
LSLARLTGVERHGYQIETVHRVLQTLRGRALLSDEVGLGKTIEALMVLLEYQVRGMASRVLILAPPALVPQWVGELAAKAGIAARTTDRDGDATWRGDGIVVASLATARMQRTQPLVQAEPWDLVIVDEAHRVKRRGSSSWKLVDGLRSRFLLLLTATPIETELEELYQLVTLLRPGQFATPAAFRRRFVDPASPTSPKNRDALRELLGEVMVRNTRASSGLKLPPRYVSTIIVDPADDERALYAAAMTALRTATEPRARRMAGLLLLEAGSSPAAVRGTLDKLDGRDGDAVTAGIAAAARVDDTRKGRALVDIVRSGGAAQLLVFTRYRATARWLQSVLLRERVSQTAEADDRYQGMTLVIAHAGTAGEPEAGCLAMIEQLILGDASPGDVIEGRDARGATSGAPAIARRALLAIEPRLDEVGAAVARRRDRERARIDEYFASLIGEARQPRRQVARNAVGARVTALHAEHAAKLRDLATRYTLRVRIDPIALVAIAARVAEIRLRLRRRKGERTLELHVPPTARAPDALACVACPAATRAPLLCDDALHVLCEACAPEVGGRPRCPACRPGRDPKKPS